MSALKKKQTVVAGEVIQTRYKSAWREVLAAALNGELEKLTDPIDKRVALPLLLALERSNESEKRQFEATKERIRQEVGKLLTADLGGVRLSVPRPLMALSDLIREAEIKTNYVISNVKDLGVRPEVIRIGQPFVVGSYPCVSVTTIEQGNATARLLILLAQVLDRGLLSNLRSCKQCQKIIIAKKNDREFCYNSKCADTYHNILKTKEGVWKTAAKTRGKRKSGK